MTNNNIEWKTIERFWPIIIVAVGFAVAFTTLQMQVSALENTTKDKGVELRKDFEETKLRQDMLIIKQAELMQAFENKLTRMEVVVEYMENGN